MYQPFLLSVALFFVTLFSFAQPVGYYNAATGTGYTLKTQLHSIINNHNSQSYSSLWTHMQSTDPDNYYENNGGVLDMYSENPSGSDPYNYNWGSDQCGNYTSEGICYNREHSFPKSWFNDASPMYTDLFHLYPTDGYVNGQRSSYPFGEVDNPSWTSMNGSKKGTCSYPGYNGTVFEPIDEFKGDFARTYFYMATRYEDRISNWNSPILNGSSDQVYVDWYLQMILEWHENDPVSQKEIDRNNAIYTIQNNRNPFIDHPEWVCQIWGGCSVNEEPDNQPTSFTATLNGTNQINLSWSDATGTNLPDGYLIKANTTGSFTNPVDGTDPTIDSNLADESALVKVGYGNETYSFTNLSATTTYYFKIWSYANAGSNIDFLETSNQTANATTLNAPVSIILEDFNSCPGTWSSISVAGSANWECNTTHLYASINAYGADMPSDDYLVSPALNLDNYTNEILTFESWTQYSDSYYPPIEILYSTDYSEDVSTATWNPLSASWSAENSQSWTPSGDISLSSINGTNVHLAFHYTSSGTGGGSSAYWKIDNIEIVGLAGGAALSASPSSLFGFTYEEGNGPSVSQSFTLSGSNLNGSQVTITAPINYEVSLDNTNFNDSETIPYTAPTLAAAIVYVRLKSGLLASNYNGSITCSDNGSASSVTIANSGEVQTNLAPVPDNYPSNFSASAINSTQIDLSWIDATGTNLPTGYLLKASNTPVFTDPANGNEPTQDTDLSDGFALLLVPYGTISYSFVGLNTATTYYFKVWPYANAGNNILYKTNGTTPTTEATTNSVGINTPNEIEKKPLIYPNPAKKQISVEFEGTYLIKVLNMQGQLLIQKNVENKLTLNVSHFSKGVYLIRVISKNEEWHKKVVIP